MTGDRSSDKHTDRASESAGAGADHRDASSPPSLFREEAVRHHSRARELGSVVRRPPRWTRVAYPVIVVLAVAGMLALLGGRSPRTVSGPGVVRSHADGFTLQVFVPASVRADLEPGAPLRAELAGRADAVLELRIETPDDRSWTADEVQGLLGPLAGRVPRGDLVAVRAALPGAGFRSGGDEQPWVEGMTATAEVSAGSEPLIFSLFPGLRAAASD